jgi:hypothetical protein
MRRAGLLFAFAVGAVVGCATSGGVGRVRLADTPESKDCASACDELIGGTTCTYRLQAHPELKTSCAELAEDCRLNCPGACVERPGGRCSTRDEVLAYREKNSAYISPALLSGPDGGFAF